MAEVELFQPISASQELLWTYLSTQGGLSCWQADEVHGSLDQRTFSLRWPSLGASMELSVKAVESGRELLLGAGQNQLRLTLADGGVSLIHSGLEKEDDLIGLRCSWRLSLSLLRQAAERHPRQARRVNWLFHPVAMSRELLHHYFSHPQGLSQWLGKSELEFVEGNKYRLELDSGTLDGRVLVCEKSLDLGLSIDTLNDSFLALRTLPGPDNARIVAVGLSNFGDPQPKAPAARLDLLRNELQQSLVRLASLGEKLPRG